MKKPRATMLSRLKGQLAHFSLPDICLIIFMLLIMFQSGHNLFVNELASQTAASLDIVIRTSAAAIFGYFISSGFKHANQSGINTAMARGISQTSASLAQNGNPTARAIGFTDETVTQVTQANDDAISLASGVSFKSQTQRQIIIISAIGIVSLIMLIISRNMGEVPPTAIATISQLRDFVSGSIGFLVGHSKLEN